MHSFLVNTIYVFCSYGTFIILFLFLKCINQALLPTTQRQHECTAMQDKNQDNVSPRLLDYWIINCPLIANQYSFYYIAIKQLDLAIVISIVVYQGLCFLQIYVCSAYIKGVTQRLSTCILSDYLIVVVLRILQLLPLIHTRISQ